MMNALVGQVRSLKNVMEPRSKTFEVAKKFLGKEVEIIFDRPLGTVHPSYKFIYEVNYGFIPNTLAPDGDELDAYYLSSEKPLKKINGICIAIVHREDDDDDKLVIVADGVSMTDKEIMQKIIFQEIFFKSFIYSKK